MKRKILIDMNLSPDWPEFLARNGMDAIHWSEIGDPAAADSAIMQWARSNGCVVFTHDLDFGRLLALNRETGPSVIQIRGQDVMPDRIGSAVVQAMRKFGTEIEAGALISIDEKGTRARALPFR